MSVFDVTALPAMEGDCLVVAYGAEGDVRHIVIDAGHKATGITLSAYLKEESITELELFVVTHIDLDHIEGALNLLDDNPQLVIKDIWFNGYAHLHEGLGALGGIQGEELTKRIAARSWNLAFCGHAVRIEGDGSPRKVDALPGGLEITLLSPSRAKLIKLIHSWEEACAKAGIVAGQAGTPDAVPAGLHPQGAPDIETMAGMVTAKDSAPANGSSIAFLMSFGGKKVLFGADAHPDILCESLNALGDGPVELDLLKVPHHGSQANVTRELMKSMRCSNFLISTSGARFRHPDQPAIARLIEGSVEPARLYFNYRQQYTEFWEDRGSLVGDPDFSCQFADIGKPITIRLI